ncbi:MAG TPA: spore germination protein GerW family protein [Candidatus Tectomicrobia bacterium]|nr:spore germination protein GerW family protein [Candidatus Tectomicrobia bacterium]
MIQATCLAIVLSLSTAALSGADTPAPDSAVLDAVEALTKFYSTEVILGKPLEIEGLNIVPIATVGVGYGRRAGDTDEVALQGTASVVSPVGVLVVSKRGVQLLPISKGLLEQVLGAVTPVVLQVLKRQEKDQADAIGPVQGRMSLSELLATLYAFVPERGWKFGVFPWPVSLVLLFLVGWLALALLIGGLFPRQMVAIATTLQDHPLRAGLVGLLSYGMVFGLAVVFTLSIIGIPFTLLLLVCTWAAKLLGTVSIAWLVGQKVAAAVRQRPYAMATHVLIGGLLLGAIRIVPVLGWVLWAILGIFGFGAVLRAQMQR